MSTLAIQHAGGVLGINSPCILTLSLAVVLRHPPDDSSGQLRTVTQLLEPSLEPYTDVPPRVLCLQSRQEVCQLLVL